MALDGRRLSLVLAVVLLTASRARAEDQPSPDTQALNLAEQAADAASKAADAAASAAAAAKAAAEAAKTVAKGSAAAPAQGQQAATAPAGEAKKEGEKKEEQKKEPAKQVWFGTASLSVISLTGNADSLTAGGSAALERRGEEWVIGFKLDGKYGQARPQPTEPFVVVAEQASLQLRLDRRFTPSTAAYIKGGIGMDHVKSVRSSSFGEAGVSITWLDDKIGDLQKRLFTTDIAIRGGYDDRFQWFPTFMALPSVTLVAPRFGLTFWYAMTKEIFFSEGAEVITNIYGPSRVLFNDTTKLAARLSASLAISIGFEVHYDSAPAAGRVPTDTSLDLGLELAL